MSIQAMSFKQVGKVIGLTREQLNVNLQAFGLIKSVGCERVYQQRGGAKESYISERFDGEFIINNACGKRDSYGKVVPDQMLDSRVIAALQERLNEKRS
ncbi:hypothetical protein [Yersinia intermedia]|uniref:hypothetical protein n=1 Tax=Yersinia intermedia TaxID=631 RepID=UPI001CFD0835|nr:hypothetical protein [Yersinia intermedia]MCB5299791.1 hypothetical protein [Yersinia intermedia]HDL7911209.1 hypothetical protein [Yersinia enterocolitica]HEN3469492.1 hypothetical protein [Yersinia enterocolitica]